MQTDVQIVCVATCDSVLFLKNLKSVWSSGFYQIAPGAKIEMIFLFIFKKETLQINEKFARIC